MKHYTIPKALLLILLFSTYLFGATLNLQQGWNLVGTNTQTTLQELKIQIGEDNLLVVQGGGKTYNKDNSDSLNIFTEFEIGKGYWIKVAQDSSIEVASPQPLSSIQLQSGWNFIAPKTLSLGEIKTQIGDENLLIIQGGGKTYNKDNQAFLNNFTGFEELNGYWVKVQGDVSISFDTTQTVNATAQLGNLANADVEVYEVDTDGSLILKLQETTSESDTLDEIGKFNAHSSELDPNKFYLYKVIGGEDWDANNDGIKDTNFSENNGTIRAIAKGSDIQSAGEEFKVTIASEILYETIARTLKYEFDNTTFDSLLNQKSALVVEDIDGDIDINDIITFDLVIDNVKLRDIYKTKLSEILDLVRQGKHISPNISPVLGSVDTPDFAYGATLSPDGTKAYVADDSSGLQIMDITDSANPSILGSVDTPSSANGATLSPDGTKAYVADGYGGLQIIDITNPANPSILGSVDTPGYARGATLSPDGTKVYVANGDSGLQIIDITDPANPLILGSIDTSDYALGVTLSPDGTKAYVADRYNGLQIIDITDPANPLILGSIDTPGWAYEVTLSPDGTKAYVADRNSGLQIIDITNPANPLILGSVDTPGWAYEVTLSPDGIKAYVADRYSGLQIIDITNPANPLILGSVDTADLAYGVTLSSDGTKAYVADGYGGLQIIDVLLFD